MVLMYHRVFGSISSNVRHVHLHERVSRADNHFGVIVVQQPGQLLRGLFLGRLLDIPPFAGCHAQQSHVGADVVGVGHDDGRGRIWGRIPILTFNGWWRFVHVDNVTPTPATPGRVHTPPAR